MELRLGLSAVLVVTFLTVVFSPIRGHAHGVNVFAWVEGRTVHTESKFSGGKRVNGGIVEVHATTGGKLLEGKTDGQGRFSFDLPEGFKDSGAGLRIVLNAGMGHQDEWLVGPEELGAIGGPDAAHAPPAAPVATGGPSPAAPPSGDAVSSTEHLHLLEQTLDRKLAPLMQRLNALEDRGPRLSEIVGGIGYIVGLIGVALFFQSRRR
jgi:nickel transport protein